MNVYETHDIASLISGNSYVGRGIVLGMTPDARRSVAAYFIMGRSANSRNRVFTKRGGEVFTEPYDASRVEDPSLIIYAAVRSHGNSLIVTNGDQTDTVYNGLEAGIGFSEALESREFEPDAPNLTPRISGILTRTEDSLKYQMSILKSADAEGSACNRYTYSFSALPGVGHFIHTYICDGTPIPTFCGEPHRVLIPGDIDELANKLWAALDPDNKISLYVRFTDLSDGSFEDRIINKNK